jgi:hypothetical protein
MARAAGTTALALLAAATLCTAGCGGGKPAAASTNRNPITAAPGVPRSLLLHGDSDKITLQWKPPLSTGDGVVMYRVRHAVSRSGPWQTFETGTVTSVGTNEPGPGSYYDVYAFNDAGRSLPTATVKVP